MPTIREGGEGEEGRERWKIKVCHNCEGRIVVYGIAMGFDHPRVSRQNGWRTHDTKQLLPSQKVELKIGYSRVKRKRGRDHACDLASQLWSEKWRFWTPWQLEV